MIEEWSWNPNEAFGTMQAQSSRGSSGMRWILGRKSAGLCTMRMVFSMYMYMYLYMYVSTYIR